MTEQQAKLCEIMEEFHILCISHHIEYYLVGHQLLHAVKDGRIHGYEMDLAMFWEDWQKIRRIGQEELGHIEIESLEDGGLLPGCYFRWVDKNTLLLDMNRIHVMSKPGIGLNIHIVRKTAYDPFLFVYEKEMRRLAREQSRLPGFLKDPARIGRMGKMAVRRLKAVAADRKSSKTALRENIGPKVYLPLESWSKKKEVYLEGMTLYSFQNTHDYLRARYGEGYLKKGPAGFKESFRCVFSASLPYAMYMEAARKEGLLDEGFVAVSSQYKKHYKEYQQMEKRERQGWDKTMFAAGERYRLWKKYMPLKEEIKKLLEEEGYDEAELILQDYMQTLEAYLGKEITICFDGELLEAVKTIYQIHEQEDILEKIDGYLQVEDLEGIRKVW